MAIGNACFYEDKGSAPLLGYMMTEHSMLTSMTLQLRLITYNIEIWNPIFSDPSFRERYYQRMNSVCLHTHTELVNITGSTVTEYVQSYLPNG